LPVPFVDLAAQQRELEPRLQDALHRALRRTDWILGAEVEEFERELAAYCGVTHAVGTDCGLSALELTLRACGVGPGDEVITAANTFIATVLAISHVSARPVLVDVDPDTCTLDPDRVQDAITARTKAIVPVHLYGQPAEMDAIRAIADECGVFIIEDACQAHGARYRGRRAGSLGHAAAFSFYPGKNLGAFGDGGAVVTDHPELADAIRVLRNYGQRDKNVHVVKGFNHRLDTLQAAVLRIKLERLDEWTERRRAHAASYTDLLRDVDVITPSVAGHVEAVWHLYVIRTPRRADVRAALAREGIQTGIHYPLPVHLQPAYAELGQGRGSFPVAEQLADEVLSLPMYPELTPALIGEVVDSLDRAVGARPAATTVAEP
jgi:dTDP-4-amino-4,6-dideoxygalactose transaminase